MYFDDWISKPRIIAYRVDVGYRNNMIHIYPAEWMEIIIAMHRQKKKYGYYK